MSTVTRNLGRVSVIPSGVWDGTKSYLRLDIVTHNGSAYIAKQDVPANTNINNTTYWMLLVEKGDVGEVTQAEFDALVADVGSKANLNTSAKTNLVAAINEVNNDKIETSEKGAANGVATLDTTGKVPSTQLPSYVDDVLEYDNKASFPATGESGKIYVDKATNLTWRWSGTTYVEISQSLALGETSSTAYRGDRGKTAYDDSQTNKTHIGTMSSLTTTEKTTLVGAINELDSDVGNKASLTTAAKTNLVAAVNELDSDIGDKSALTTTTKTNLVSAVNELDADIGDKSTLTTEAKTNLVAAVNELDAATDSIDDIIDEKLRPLSEEQTFGYDDIVTFNFDVEGLKLKSTKIKLEPQQDLHGYDHPWPGGGGKNLLPIEAQSGTVSGVTFTVLRDGNGNVTGVKASGTAEAETVFQLFDPDQKTTESIGLIHGNRYILSGCPKGGSANTYNLRFQAWGSGSDFIDYGDGRDGIINTGTRRLNIVIAAGVTVSNLVFQPMIRLASVTDATFAPYSNICPIEGYDEVNIHNGVNVWDEVWEPGGYWSDGTLDNTYASIRSKNYIPVEPNTAYYITYNLQYLHFYTESKTRISYVGTRLFTTPSNCRYIRFSLSNTYGTTYKNDVSINRPATETSYYPYIGNTVIPINWHSQAGTVYSGTLDASTGELVVDHGLFTITGSESNITWAMSTSETVRQEAYANVSSVFPNVNTNGVQETALFNLFKTRTLQSITPVPGMAYIQNGYVNLVFEVGTFANVNEIKTWLGNNNVQVYYELATLQTYTLTPQQITTLLGTNNVWTDSGQVKVTLDSTLGSLKTYTDDAVSPLYESTALTTTDSEQVITFDSKAEGVPLHDVKVTMEPQQDLHGYDHPWPAGGGKNLLPLEFTSKTIAGVTVVVNKDGSITFSGTATSEIFQSLYFTHDWDVPAGTYKFSFGENLATGCIWFQIANKSETQQLYSINLSNNTSGSVNVISDWVGDMSVRLIIANGVTVTGTTIYPMVLPYSETDSTFEPYSNICPIEGYDEVEVTRTGKNLLDVMSWSSDGLGVDSWETSKSKIQNIERLYLKVFDKGTYAGSFWLKFYDDKGSLVFETNTISFPSISNGYTTTIDVPNDGYSFSARGYMVNHGTNHNMETVKVCISSEPCGDAYEPFGTTTTVNLKDASGTVYGGTLDVTTGELVVEKVCKTLNTARNLSSTYHGSIIYNSLSPETEDADFTKPLICNRLKYVGSAVSQDLVYGTCINALQYSFNLWISPAAFADLSEASAWLAANETQICYWLKNPITYHLTPQQITSVLGTNHMWTDADKLEVEQGEYLQTLSDRINNVETQVTEINNNPIYTYSGKDLSMVFGSAEALHEAVAAGDFSKIHIGDYWPITLNGTFHDYAAGADKTINANVKMEVAAINPYLRHGDTELTAQHILFCSRDCLPPTLQMRSANDVWYDTTQVNPWRGSALYETLNNATNGIIKLVEATNLGDYVFGGPNNKGMRAELATIPAGQDEPTGWAWTDRGKLFLPAEREVYGASAWGSTGGSEAGNLYNQWPIFAGSSRHLIKGAGDGGARSLWWEETSNNATRFTCVYMYGHANAYVASDATLRVPLCFLFV